MKGTKFVRALPASGTHFRIKCARTSGRHSWRYRVEVAPGRVTFVWASSRDAAIRRALTAPETA